jgi:hypothetical protein
LRQGGGQPPGHDARARRDLEDAAGRERSDPRRQVDGVRLEDQRYEMLFVELRYGSAEDLVGV